jgi:hypothetical protein
MCSAYFTTHQSYLMMILSGSVFGAVYEEKYYEYFVDIAYQMTVKNSLLYKLKPSDRWINFADICKFLLTNTAKQNEFRSEIIAVIVKNYGDKDLYKFKHI